MADHLMRGRGGAAAPTTARSSLGKLAWPLVISALVAAPAYAQDSAENNEIVVTAQKREQRLSDVPINISAFSEDFLDRTDTHDFHTLADFTPGLQVQEQGANRPTFVMRGINSDGGEATDEPRVAIFQDGVSLSRSRGAYVELFDLERVEVAKGPQATLFGRSALIGGINIIQNKASFEGTEALFDASIGDVGQRALTGVFNQELIDDTLAVRLAARYKTRDGFIDNTFGGRLGDTEVESYRIALRWEPLSTLRFDLIGGYQTDEGSSSATVANRIANVNGEIDLFNTASLNGLAGFQDGASLGLDRWIQNVTLIGEWKINPYSTLTSISGHRRFDSREVLDPDGSYLPLFAFAEYAAGEQTSQELRFVWDDGGIFTWFVGASYFHETGSQAIPLGFDERMGLPLLTGDLQAAFPSPNVALLTDPATSAALLQAYAATNGTPISNATAAGIVANLRPLHQEFFTNYSDTTSYDLYADSQFQVTDRFDISLGIRYTWDDKTTGLESGIIGAERSVLGGFVGAFNASTPVIFRPFLLNALATPGAPFIPQSGSYPIPNIALFTQPSFGIDEASGEFGALTWRAVARYEFSDDASMWASVARGRRPEVISVESPAVPDGDARFTQLPAEWVSSAEIGGALNALHGALALNGSVYFYQYTDFQTTEFTNGRLINVTAGDAEAYGLETQADLRFSADMRIFASYAYNHARFTSGAREGNHFRLAPDHTISVGAFLAWPVANGKVYLTPTYSWRSEVFFDDDNDRPEFQDQRVVPTLSDVAVDERQGSYGLLNLRFGFQSADERWSLGVYGTNLTDEEYLTDGGSAGDSFGLPTFTRGPGRLLGVELKTRL